MHKACMWCHFHTISCLYLYLYAVFHFASERNCTMVRLNSSISSRDLETSTMKTDLFLRPNGTSNPVCPEIHLGDPLHKPNVSRSLFSSKNKRASSPDRIYGNFSLQDSSWRHATSPEGSWRFCLRLVRHRSWTGSQSISPDGSKQVCFSALEGAAIKLKAKSYMIWNTGCSCGVCVCTLYITLILTFCLGLFSRQACNVISVPVPKVSRDDIYSKTVPHK